MRCDSYSNATFVLSTQVFQDASTATFACTKLGPAVYRILLHFEPITEFWDFSQLVVERKRVGAFCQQRIDSLVHRAAEMIPNHPIVSETGKTGTTLPCL